MENIIENNKLIAEFMGFDGQHEEWCGNNIVDLNEFVDENQLRPYNPHERWDDLMPVYKQMRNCLESMLRPTVNHCCKGDMIELDASLELTDINIKGVYKHIVEFIKWHNEQNQ